MVNVIGEGAAKAFWLKKPKAKISKNTVISILDNEIARNKHQIDICLHKTSLARRDFPTPIPITNINYNISDINMNPNHL